MPRGSVRLMMVSRPQFVRLKLPGPTRSFICAVPEFPDVRLTPNAFPKATHCPIGKTPAFVRSTPASPHSFVPSVSVVGAISSSAVAGRPFAPVSTAASAVPAPSVVAGPQHGAVSLLISQAPDVTQRRSVSVGTSVVPPSKSYTISMSPGDRWTSPPEAAPHDVLPLLNSNATCADGDVVFCVMRTHASIRYVWPFAPVLLAR